CSLTGTLGTPPSLTCTLTTRPARSAGMATLSPGDRASVTTSWRCDLQRGLCEGRTGVERPASRPDQVDGTWPDICRYQVPHLQEDTVAWGDLRADSSAVQYVLPVTGKLECPPIHDEILPVGGARVERCSEVA